MVYSDNRMNEMVDLGTPLFQNKFSRLEMKRTVTLPHEKHLKKY
jgi:hypothetical protein